MYKYSESAIGGGRTFTMLKQYKMVSQSTEMQRATDDEILQYVSTCGNHLLVYARHAQFNGQALPHDRNARTYACHLSADNLHVFVLMENPHAMAVFNMQNGEMNVIQGLDELRNHKIIAIAIQPKDSNKKSNTRKVNIILEARGTTHIKAVQFEGAIDSSPKVRTKMLEENATVGPYRAAPIFSAHIWNHFIYCRKQMKVCKAGYANDEISLKFAVQAFEANLTQLFTSYLVVAMSESPLTWAVLTGNKYTSRQDDPMVLNVFWQHQGDQDVNRNMYFRDGSNIKSVTLPATHKQFVKLWFFGGYYLVEVTGSQRGSHRCLLIHEKQQSDTVCLNLLDDSKLCCQSLNPKEGQISICEIVDRKILFCTKVVRKQWSPADALVQQPQTLFRDPKKSERDGETTEQPKTTRQLSIKSFMTVPEAPANKTQQRKETAQPGSDQANAHETRGLINEKIVQHLSKVEESKNERSSLDSDIEVPQTVRNVISFGAPEQGNRRDLLPPPKVQNKRQAADIVSFGASGLKQKSPEVKNNSSAPNQKKQSNEVKKITFKKQMADAIKASMGQLVKEMAQTIEQKFQTFSENYKQATKQVEIKIEPVFSRQDVRQLHSIESTQKRHSSAIHSRISEKKAEGALADQLGRKLGRLKEISQAWASKLQVNMNEGLAQLQSLRKKTVKNKKSVVACIADDIRHAAEQITVVQSICAKITDQLQGQISDVDAQSMQQKKASIRQIFRELHMKQARSRKMQVKIPIPRCFVVSPQPPALKLQPL